MAGMPAAFARRFSAASRGAIATACRTSGPAPSKSIALMTSISSSATGELSGTLPCRSRFFAGRRFIAALAALDRSLDAERNQQVAGAEAERAVARADVDHPTGHHRCRAAHRTAPRLDAVHRLKLVVGVE